MTKQTPPLKAPLSQRMPRMAEWLLITLLLTLLVWLIAPQQLPVSLYKLSLVTLAAVVGYWIDRSLFPYARPDVFLALDGVELVDSDGDDGPDGAELLLHAAPDSDLLRAMGQAMLRRAIIVAATMLAVGLGA